MSTTISERAGAAPYSHSIAGCLDGAIGKHGLSQDELTPWIERLAPALDALQGDYRERRLPLLRIAEDEADIVAAEAALAKLSVGARAVIFFGTGGSSLGGQTLAQLGGWNIPGLADEAQKNRPRTRFYDNLDPVTLESALGTFDLDTARFVVTSKSGGTPETLAQALAAMAALRAAGLEARIPELFLGITEPRVAGKANGLRDLFEALGIPVLEHHTGIGGRFSGLTNVGLLPALARGLDVRAVRAGARSVVEAMMGGRLAVRVPAGGRCGGGRGAGARARHAYARDDALHRPAGALLALVRAAVGGEPRQGRAGHGADRLRRAARPAQPAAAVHGRPARAPDHASCACRPRASARSCRLIWRPRRASAYLAGKTVGDLVAAQSHAVPEALGRAGRPVRTFDLDRLDEASLGALMMHCMLETILAARLMGVDPFDQPAVELAKVITRERVAKG